MGWWHTDEKGHSFASRDRAVGLWGDEPADYMACIVDAFEEAFGRPPTDAEVLAGLRFHLPKEKVNA